MNKLKLLPSTLILPCLLMSVTGFAAEQDNDQYSGMYKQLSIMSDIIKSSVSDKSARQPSQINSIQSTYLRGQGVVFTISSAANNRQWGHYNFNFVMPEMPEMPVAPIAPEVNQDFREKYDIDVNETVSKALESAADGYERVVEVFEHNRDKTRAFRDQQRDIAYRLRDVEREKRDLNYQLSRATDDRKAELKSEIYKLTEQEKTYRGQLQKLTELNNKVAAEQKVEQEKRNQERFS